MSDYENIVISAVRYALGRLTYIVSLTVEYVLKDIEENKLSSKCLQLIKRDIAEELNPDKLRVDPIFTADCIEDWQRLLKKIDEAMKVIK